VRGWTKSHNRPHVFVAASYTVVTLIFSTTVMFALTGVMWTNTELFHYVSYFTVFVLGICGLGFVICGALLVRVMCKGKNKVEDRYVLPGKIVAFIIWYTTATFVTTVVEAFNILGHVFGGLFVCTASLLGLVSAFLFLLLKVKERDKRVQTCPPPKSKKMVVCGSGSENDLARSSSTEDSKEEDSDRDYSRV